MKNAILIFLCCFGLGCQERSRVTETEGRIVPLGTLNMDVLSIGLTSFGKIISADLQNEIQYVNVDMFNFKVRFQGVRLEPSHQSCSFERPLSVSEYQKLRSQYQAIDVCEYQSSSQTSNICLAMMLAEGISLTSSKTSMFLSQSILDTCNPGPTACSSHEYEAFRDLMVDLFRTDFDSCAPDATPAAASASGPAS
jgi:hypothetical protein